MCGQGLYLLTTLANTRQQCPCPLRLLVVLYKYQLPGMWNHSERRSAEKGTMRHVLRHVKHNISQHESVVPIAVAIVGCHAKCSKCQNNFLPRACWTLRHREPLTIQVSYWATSIGRWVWRMDYCWKYGVLDTENIGYWVLSRSQGG